MPEPYEGAADALTRLILFKCLRADKLPNEIERIVARNLGEPLIETRCVDLAQVFEQSSAQEPVVIFSSADGDDGNEMQDFVEKMGFAERFVSAQRQIFFNYLVLRPAKI